MINAKAGEKVWVLGWSGFCGPDEQEVVVAVDIRYDNITGKKYKEYVLSGERRFDGRDGHAITPPLAYSIQNVVKQP